MSDYLLSTLEKISVSLSNDSTIKNRSKLLAQIINTREQISKAARIQSTRATLFANPAISLTPILNLITTLQINIDQNDYLQRRNATTPLADQPIKESEIPAIFKAVTLLVNIVIDQKERELQKFVGTNDIASAQSDTLLAKFNITLPNTRKTLEPVTANQIKALLNQLRVYLITNTNRLANNIITWVTINNYGFTEYPNKEFELNKQVLDHIEIDRILQKKHYSNIPIEEAVNNVHLGGSQPSYVKLQTDVTVQYNEKTGLCFQLNDNYRVDGSYYEVNYKPYYPVNFISVGISNCHTILIRDEYGHVWALHVSPASMQKHAAFTGIIGTKPAYSELSCQYDNPSIQLKGNIEIIVIEKYLTCFRESLLRECLPWNIHIASFKRIEVDAYVNLEYPYSVCYATGTNELVISGAKETNGMTERASFTIPNVFNLTPAFSASNRLPDQNDSEELDDKISTFLISLEINIRDSETIIDKSSLLSKVAEVRVRLSTSELNLKDKYELLLTILRALQENINQYDYLNRNKASIPIVDQPIKAEYIPYLYIAVTKMIDIMIDIKKRGITKVISANEINSAIVRLRGELISNEKNLPYEIESWLRSLDYDEYPRKAFNKHRKILDAIEIDLIIQKKHYSTLSTEETIRSIRTLGFSYITIKLPSVIVLEVNNTLFYNPITRNCFGLNSAFNLSGNFDQVQHHEQYPLNFVAYGTTDGHVVLIKDEQNHIWMLSTSQSAVTRKIMTNLEITLGPPKHAYSDLGIKYNHDEIKLCGKLDIIVIDNPNGFFNRDMLESHLPKNTEIASLRMIEADYYIKESKAYSVSYLPETDQLTIVGYQRENWKIEDKVMKLDNVFHAPTINLVCR